MPLTMQLESEQMERVFYSHLRTKDQLLQFFEECKEEFLNAKEPLIVEIWRKVPQKERKKGGNPI